LSKKIEYYGIVFHINYDPIEELYYSGIPGYLVPTIYVGKLEAEVQEYVEDLLIEYLEHCKDQGFCNGTEISYNAQEAYCSGWIVRAEGCDARGQGFKEQMIKHIESEEINFLDYPYATFLKLGSGIVRMIYPERTYRQRLTSSYHAYCSRPYLSAADQEYSERLRKGKCSTVQIQGVFFVLLSLLLYEW